MSEFLVLYSGDKIVAKIPVDSLSKNRPSYLFDSIVPLEVTSCTGGDFIEPGTSILNIRSHIPNKGNTNLGYIRLQLNHE